MERTVVNPSFLKLIEINSGKDFASIKDPLSVVLEGYLKNLKYNKYPAANDFSKAGIFIQNAAFIYSMNVDDLFIFVTELHSALCKINLQQVVSNAAAPSTPNVSTVTTENNTPGESEESDEQVTASKSRKQSRKKIEEYDCDPTDIADPWTADNIDEVEEEQQNEDQSEFIIDQDLEVETVLAQCDNFESTSSFIRRDDVNEERSKDIPRRVFRILSPMDDDGFISTDFNIFDEKKSKRYSLMLNTIDMLEGSELTEIVNRDMISLEPASVTVNAEAKDDNDQDDNMEHNQNPQKRMDIINKEDELYDVKKVLLYDNRDDMFSVPFKCLDEFCKKYVKRNVIYKYELNRTVHCDRLKLSGALNILCGTSKLNCLDSEEEDPDVGFEGFQSLYDEEWFGWPHTEDSVEVPDTTLELTPTDTVPDLDESQFVPEPERIRKPGVEDVHKNVFTKKAARWIEMYKPIVEKTSNRKKFNIREYGDKVIETFESTQTNEKTTEPPKKTLEDVLGTQSFQEASKYFLAVLVLANNGNLELEKPTKDPLTVNTCNIKLLKRERHHDKFDQDIAVHTVIQDKKGKKK
ncbi:hypothetical protein M8J76_008668 [Diaphorina citri]|nr:hypothetical protein M8J76_008668 [Diaphorina citri]